MNVYEIVLLVIIAYGLWWVWTHAPQIASDNPWKTFLYLGSLAGVVIFFGYFLISGFDWTFTRFDTDARQSRMLAAVAQAFGLSPQGAGLTGQGTFLSREGGFQIPDLVSAPESVPSGQTGVQIQASQPVTNGLVEFTTPYELTLAHATLTLIHADGTYELKYAADVGVPAACGMDASAVDNEGDAIFLITCPFSDGTRFLAADVVLPAGFPKPADLAVVTQPLLGAPVETGGGEPVYMTPEQQGTCWLDWANGVGLSTITQEQGPLFLPRGTEWRLKGPGNWQSAFTGKGGEKFTLSNAALGIDNYPINGWVGRSFPLYDDAGVVVVKGMGDICIAP